MNRWAKSGVRDVMFLAFINVALIVEGLRYCEQALV
jgi:hypothetical protein